MEYDKLKYFETTSQRMPSSLAISAATVLFTYGKAYFSKAR
jgi:hypothetical protein